MTEESPRYTLGQVPSFGRILEKLKRKDRALLRELERGVAKVLRAPALGKPLGNILRNYRRIHISGSFVLLYEVRGHEVRLVDFDHHNNIYKKYS